VLLAMAIGLPSCVDGIQCIHDTEPFTLHKKYYHSDLKPTNTEFMNEILRRTKHYGLKPCRPSQWKKNKMVQWLLDNKMDATKQAKDHAYITNTIASYKVFIANSNLSNGQARKANMDPDEHYKRGWYGFKCHLRFYHTLLDDEIRESLSKAFSSMTREELDARNSSMRPPTFFELAAVKYNDPKWIPRSLPLPDLHDDFKYAMDLPLQIAPADAQTLKKHFGNNRANMVLVVGRWEKSGSGKAMINESVSEAEVYKFIDGDDRATFLWSEPPHVLYLWHISYTHDILPTVRQQLANGVLADGDVTTKTSVPINGGRKHKPEVESVQQTTLQGMMGIMRSNSEQQKVDRLYQLYSREEAKISKKLDEKFVCRHDLEETISSAADFIAEQMHAAKYEKDAQKKEVIQVFITRKTSRKEDAIAELKHVNKSIKTWESKMEALEEKRMALLEGPGAGSGGTLQKAATAVHSDSDDTL
jgi:hypothetical protein